MVSLMWSSVSKSEMSCCYAHGSNNACKLQLLILFHFFSDFVWCDKLSLLFMLCGILYCFKKK